MTYRQQIKEAERLLKMCLKTLNRPPCLPGPSEHEVWEQVQEFLSNQKLQRQIERDPELCPGGVDCTCCGPHCDCGCRNDCPRYRASLKARKR